MTTLHLGGSFTRQRAIPRASFLLPITGPEPSVAAPSPPPTQSEDSVKQSSWLTPRGTYCSTTGLVYTDGNSPESELYSYTGQERVAGGAGHLQSVGAVHAQGTK